MKCLKSLAYVLACNTFLACTRFSGDYNQFVNCVSFSFAPLSNHQHYLHSAHIRSVGSVVNFIVVIVGAFVISV